MKAFIVITATALLVVLAQFNNGTSHQTSSKVQDYNQYCLAHMDTGCSLMR